MDIQLAITSIGASTDYYIVNLYDPTALSTVIATKYLQLPLANTTVIDFTNLNDQTYIVRQFLSPTTNWQDGTQYGSDYRVNPGYSISSIVRDDLWIRIPASGGFSTQGSLAGDVTGWLRNIVINGLNESNTDGGKIYFTTHILPANPPYYPEIFGISFYSDSAHTHLLNNPVIQSPSGSGWQKITFGGTYSGSMEVNISTFANSTNVDNIYTIGEISNNAYQDNTLVGWKYDIEQRGMGTLEPGVDINILSTGGFEFINDYEFQPDEIYVIHFQPQISSIPSTGGNNSSNIGLSFSDVLVLNSDTILDPSCVGKIIKIQGATSSISIVLPEISTIPDNKIIPIISSGGSHIMAKIVASGSFSWLGGIRTYLYMAQNEELMIYKNGSNWFILHSDGNFKNVGELVDSHLSSQMNCLICNGQALSRSLYPRLWEWIQNNFSSSPNLLISDTTWKLPTLVPNPQGNFYIYPNIGKFSIGNGTTTFRLPLLIKAKDGAGNFVSSGFLRYIGAPDPGAGISGLSGDASIGRNEQDSVGNFFANIRGDKVLKSGSSNSIIALGHDGGGGNPDPELGYATKNSVPFQGQYYDGSYYNSGETKPMNIGIYKLIRY